MSGILFPFLDWRMGKINHTAHRKRIEGIKDSVKIQGIKKTLKNYLCPISYNVDYVPISE